MPHSRHLHTHTHTHTFWTDICSVLKVVPNKCFVLLCWSETVIWLKTSLWPLECRYFQNKSMQVSSCHDLLHCRELFCRNKLGICFKYCNLFNLKTKGRIHKWKRGNACGVCGDFRQYQLKYDTKTWGGFIKHRGMKYKVIMYSYRVSARVETLLYKQDCTAKQFFNSFSFSFYLRGTIVAIQSIALMCCTKSL